MFSCRALEILRYGVVGFTLNFFGYLLYLGVTSLGVDPLITVTVFYPTAVLIGFFAHRRHTFRLEERGLKVDSLARYVFVYVLGYFLNLGLLGVFWGILGYPHQLVQAASIFVCAGVLFLAMKLIVFPPGNLVN